MSRRMWPYNAERKFSVRGTYEQASAWGYAASVKGLPVPVFIALAADDYADRLMRRIAREKRKEAKE
jgi:hypothetical protein